MSSATWLAKLAILSSSSFLVNILDAMSDSMELNIVFLFVNFVTDNILSAAGSALNTNFFSGLARNDCTIADWFTGAGISPSRSSYSFINECINGRADSTLSSRCFNVNFSLKLFLVASSNSAIVVGWKLSLVFI